LDINRKQLARQMAAERGWTISAALQAVDDVTNTILDNLAAGNTVSIYGFGCFDVLARKEHVVPDRLTGEMKPVPAHWIPRFYPGERMRRIVKKLELEETGEVD